MFQKSGLTHCTRRDAHIRQADQILNFARRGTCLVYQSSGVPVSVLGREATMGTQARISASNCVPGNTYTTRKLRLLDRGLLFDQCLDLTRETRPAISRPDRRACGCAPHTCPFSCFAVAHHQHVRNLLQLRFANLEVHLLVAVVEVARMPGVSRVASAPSRAYSVWRSVIGSTIACTGASQTGNAPA